MLTTETNVLYKTFHTIGILGRPRDDNNLQMHKNLFHWLLERGYHILVEKEIGELLQLAPQHLATIDEIGQKVQLAIVVGGDGNMLGRARKLAKYDTLLIGINRGNLGFLTDIDPHKTYSQLTDCLEKGEFFIEERFLLDVLIERDNEIIQKGCAINEIVTHPEKIAHMMDFHVYINDKFAFSQRSDGLIVATPTGSTAYSLSAGGPIMTPDLNAIALVPMFPHKLSARPLILDGDSKVSIRFSEHKMQNVEVSCDSQEILSLIPSDVIHVQKSVYRLRFLHLKSYNYYNVLTTKLGWLREKI